MRTLRTHSDQLHEKHEETSGEEVEGDSGVSAGLSKYIRPSVTLYFRSATPEQMKDHYLVKT